MVSGEMKIELKSRYLKLSGRNTDNDRNEYTANGSNGCGGDDDLQVYDDFAGYVSRYNANMTN